TLAIGESTGRGSLSRERTSAEVGLFAETTSRIVSSARATADSVSVVDSFTAGFQNLRSRSDPIVVVESTASESTTHHRFKKLYVRVLMPRQLYLTVQPEI